MSGNIFFRWCEKPVGMGKYQFGTGGARGPDELERAIAAVRELGALLLEIREASGGVGQRPSRKLRLKELTDKCASLESSVRELGVPLIDIEFSDWLRAVLDRQREREPTKVDKEGLLRLANLVANWRVARVDNRGQPHRGPGGANRPIAEVVSSVPLSVVPKILTLEAALRISEKVKRQLLLNEGVAATAQTAKLAQSALRLLDPAHRIDFG